MAATEIRVPDLGNFKDVAVIDVLVKAGERVEVDTPLLTLETEKATMDVPSPAAGVIERVHVTAGGKVSAGEPGRDDACRCGRGAGLPPAAAPVAPAACSRRRRRRRVQRAAAALPRARRCTRPCRPSTRPALRARTPVRRCGSSRASWASTWRACAAAGRRAASRTTTSRPASSGHERRRARPAAPPAPALPKVPVVDFAQFGPVEIKPLARIQKISGPRLHASWVNLPHVTQFDQADITELEEARKALQGARRRRRA